jgi:transcriptional regulator with XRE-family HTH domain
MTKLPPIRHRLLGAVLRRFRTQSGCSLGGAAAVLECHRSTISRMETGRRGIRPAELRGLLAAYGAEQADQDTLLTMAGHIQDPRWWRLSSHNHDAYQDLMILAGPDAAMWVYEAQCIPGLLQTEDYARGIAATALAREGQEAREQFTRNRLAQQQVLIGGGALGLSAILSEAALRQLVSGPAVMRAQLRHLVELSNGQRNVTLQVLPFTADTDASSTGPFAIMSFPGPGQLAVVRLAGQTHGVYLDDEEDVARYALLFQHLCASALPPAQSARLIGDIAMKL